MGYAHLHVHTAYSILDGTCRVPELIRKAKEYGMEHLAITDHGVMYGVPEFYLEAKKQGIHPVIGCEVYVAPSSRLDHTLSESGEKYYHLVLLAETTEGYHNLIHLSSRGFTEGFYFKPRVDKELLRRYSKGLIALSACLQGEVQRRLRQDRYEEARRAALEYREIFGENNFFLEMQDHGLEDQKKVNLGLMRLSQETGIPTVVTNDIHYIEKKDAETHDIFLCLQTRKTLDDPNRMRYVGGQYYLKTEEEMRSLFPYAEEAVNRTEEIAKRCEVDIPFGGRLLPKFRPGEGITLEGSALLRELCRQGMKERYGDSPSKEAKERLEYELGVIESMGFVDYFLIVWDYINYARGRSIMVGPGRGSAAGSLVAYVLKITDVDPLKYNLLFERFLNPERISMPDIDVDFGDTGRPEVIDYVIKKYGRDKVGQIITFNTLKPRAVIQDVSKVLKVPESLSNRLRKMIPEVPGITLQRAFDENPDLRELEESDPAVHKLLEVCRSLEGLLKNVSVHAAGVVISDQPLENHVPFSLSSDSMVTQYAANYLEDLGLLKMDLLGIRNLTIIQETIRRVKEKKGISLKPEEFPSEDKEVYAMISRGETEGIFQLESEGMKAFMKELRPECFEDIVAGISLYRPGPMDDIPKYIEARRDPSKVRYLTEELRPILQSTYGCMVYQEQVMQIVRDLAGYSYGRSDLVRRAMSKKKYDVMQKERQVFLYGSEDGSVPGCIRKGISREIGEKLFDEMTEFANYAFNKSHAAAYAVVAYWMAYLKTHFTKEFMASLLTYSKGKTSRFPRYIEHLKKLGIPLLFPDVQKSMADFTAEEGGIRYGLASLKGVGEKMIHALEEERKKGNFDGLKDFVMRLAGNGLTKRDMESLIYAGALDAFPGNRKQKLEVFPVLLDEAQKKNRREMSGQISLFDAFSDMKKAMDIKLPNTPEMSREELLNHEYEITDTYLSGHPLDEDRSLLSAHVTAYASDLSPEEDESSRIRAGRMIRIGGRILTVKVLVTKKGEQMARIVFEDLTGRVNVIAFPKTYAKYKSVLKENRHLLLEGTVKEEVGENVELELILGAARETATLPVRIWIQLEDKESLNKEKNRLMSLQDSGGEDLITVYLSKEKSFHNLCLCSLKGSAEAVLKDLRRHFGEQNVKVRARSIELKPNLM